MKNEIKHWNHLRIVRFLPMGELYAHPSFKTQSKFNSSPTKGEGIENSSPTRKSIKTSNSESNLPKIKDWPERKQGTIIYPKDIEEDAVPFTYSPPGKYPNGLGHVNIEYSY